MPDWRDAFEPAHTPPLVPYGIHAEHAEICVHVSSEPALYFFSTAAGRAATELAVLRSVNVKNERRATGWAVPIADIAGVRRIAVPDWKRAIEFQQQDTTSGKGQLALRCVIDAIERGLVPHWSHPVEVTDLATQRQGIDLYVDIQGRRRSVQVKCDLRTGETGNLFLQYEECNPDRQY